MAKTKKNGKTKKKYNKKKYYKKNKTGVPLGQTFKTTLKYCERLQAKAEVYGQSTIQIFSANSIYDPNSSGAGHQPMGFDQIEPLYNKYTVIGSKIVCQVAGVTNNNAILAIYKGENTLSSTDVIEKIVESGNCTYTIIPQTSVGLSGAKSGTTRRLTSNFSPVKDGMVSKGNVLTDGKLTAQVNSNPLSPYFYSIVLAPFNPDVAGNNDPEIMGELTLMITIYYTVVFSEPKKLSQS